MGADPLFVKIDGAYYWYQNDHQGTPQKIISTSGSVVWAAVALDSFGNVKIQAANIVNNLRMPGQYYDEETGLYYNWHRYYDPAIGRYLQTDPIGDGLNLYAYCNNDPVNFMDPMGLCAAKNFFTEQGQADFWAGFGDAITLGGTKWIREQWNREIWGFDTVDYNSDLYAVGEFAGYTVGAIIIEQVAEKISDKDSKEERASKKGTFPDEIFSKKAPGSKGSDMPQVAPGTKKLEGQYINEPKNCN
jgi:RHS repeat-associated protein